MNTIKQQQIHEVYNYAIAGISGNLFTSLIIFYILIGHVSNTQLNIWLASILMILLLRSVSAFIYKQSNQSKKIEFNASKWILTYQIGVFFTGIAWIIVPFLFSKQYQVADLNLIMSGLAFGLAGAGITTLGSVFRVYVAFITPLTLGVIYILFSTDIVNYFELGFIAIFGLFFMLFAAYKHSKRTYELIEKTYEAKQSRIEIIEKLGKAAEFRDNETGQHVERMSYSSYLLALKSGLSSEDANQILLASPMHDIGKIGISDNILLKPGKLTNDEFEIIKTHTSIGAEILTSNNSRLLKLATIIAKNHHEKWDGSGYPNGLAGDAIPLEARIVSICDVFDALVSDRPYKKAWSTKDALEFIRDQSGKHFDPNLVNHFVAISDQVIDYTDKHRDIDNNSSHD